MSIDSSKPPSEELFEGVLLRARDEYQEKKLRHLGCFLADIAFAENISAGTAHLLLRDFERLTYRQLCILAVIRQRVTIDVEALRRPDHTDPELDALKREEMELHSNDLGTLGLIKAAGAWTDELTALGLSLCDLAALDEISVDDVNAVAVKLAGKATNSA